MTPRSTPVPPRASSGVLSGVVCTALALLVLAAPSVRAQRMSQDELLKKAEQAVRLDDKRTLDRLVKDETLPVVQYLRGHYLSVQKGRQPDTAIKDAFHAAWGRVFEGSNAPQKMERWVQGLGAQQIKLLDELERNLIKVWNGYASAGAKNPTLVQQTAGSLQTLAENFRSMGDYYKAAETWELVAIVWKDKPGAGTSDIKEALFAAQQYQAARQQLDWTKDSQYQQWLDWVSRTRDKLEAREKTAEQRAAEGYEKDVAGVEAVLVPGAEPQPIELEASVMKRPRKQEIGLRGGEVGANWYAESLWRTSGPKQIAWFQAKPLFLVRPGPAKFGIALTGNEKDLEKLDWQRIDAPNKTRSKAEELVLDEEKGTTYAMWFYTGGTTETWMGVNQNLAPSPDNLTVYFKSAMEWEGEFEDEDITIWDENANGTLFDVPSEVAFKSKLLAENPEKDPDVEVPTFDSVQVGKRGSVQPLGGWLKIGDRFWRVEGTKDGEMSVRKGNPAYLKTGKLKLDWSAKRIKLNSLIVRCTTKPFDDAYFNLADEDEIEVPAGNYELVQGSVYSGKGARMETAWLFPGPTTEKVTVEEGETATFELGSPFKLDFVRDGTEDRLILSSFTIKPVGRGGEIYTHLNGCQVEPEVMVARDDTGKGARPIAEFRKVGNGTELNQFAQTSKALGAEVGYFPKVDGANPITAVVNERVDPGAKVGLVQAKHEFFGKLEAIWK